MPPVQRRLTDLFVIGVAACHTACTSTGSSNRGGKECAAVNRHPLDRSAVVVCSARAEKGHASYYSRHMNGCKTASGERYHAEAYTAAHRKLPFGTKVRVENLRNGQEVTLRINDRGPYVKGRVIDVSEAAARKLGMTGSGVAPVEIVVVD